MKDKKIIFTVFIVFAALSFYKPPSSYRIEGSPYFWNQVQRGLMGSNTIEGNIRVGIIDEIQRQMKAQDDYDTRIDSMIHEQRKVDSLRHK